MAELNQIRPEIIALSQKSLRDGSIVGAPLKQQISATVLVHHAFTPATVGAALPRPPVIAIRVAVYNAGPGKGDVLLPVRVDTSGIVHALHALPARVYRRQVALGVLRELEGCSGRNMQVDVALQMNGSGE